MIHCLLLQDKGRITDGHLEMAVVMLAMVPESPQRKHGFAALYVLKQALTSQSIPSCNILDTWGGLPVKLEPSRSDALGMLCAEFLSKFSGSLTIAMSVH